MVSAFRSGLMELSMKVFGRMAKLMEEANSGMQMVTFTTGIGRRTRLTVMEFIFMLTEPGTKVIGKLICNMGKVLRFGQMAPSTMENTRRDLSMGMVSINGLMVPLTMEVGSITRLKAR